MRSEANAGGACQFLDPDHFEIRVMRRSNPATREPPEWRYRVRVLASSGLTLNYSLVLNCGEERELHPSETLTVATPPGPNENAHIELRPLPKGIHFTFIPYMGSFGQSTAPTSGVAQEVPRPLPDLAAPELETDLDGGLVLERTAPSVQSATAQSVRSAGALRPPMAMSFEGDGERANSVAQGRNFGAAPMKTVLLEPMDENGQEDDLFSRTGFGALSAEDKMPPVAGSPAHRRNSR